MGQRKNVGCGGRFCFLDHLVYPPLGPYERLDATLSASPSNHSSSPHPCRHQELPTKGHVVPTAMNTPLGGVVEGGLCRAVSVGSGVAQDCRSCPMVWALVMYVYVGSS
jgi:hypothetical protein